MKPKILLIEDEANLARGLMLNFELEGYTVEWAATGAEARAACASRTADLVVLDLMLPDADGFDLLREIKLADPRQPVLVLTARADDDDRVAGLTLGADDYVTKPFNLKELVLRVRGIVRRGNWYRPRMPDTIQIGEATLLPDQSTLILAEHNHLLTDLELQLLVHLWEKRGTPVSREALLVEVWGYAPETSSRTVDIFISRLRRMLGDDAAAPRLLLTRRGHGYMLVDETGQS